MFDELNKIDIKAIRSFIAIAECQGVTAAQSRLNISPSVISGHLSHLEEMLDMTLCQRGRGGFELTEDGKAVYEACSDFQSSIANFRHQLHYIRQLDSEHGVHIKLSLSDQLPDTFNDALQKTLANYYATNPATHFSIRVQSPEVMSNSIIHGDSDLGVGYFARLSPSLNFTPACEEQQVICCGKKHPLFTACDDDIDTNSLNEDFAWVERGYAMDEKLLRVHPKNLTATTYHMEATAHLILAGYHLGYLPLDFAKRQVVLGEMRIILQDELSYTVTHHWASRPKLTKPIATFMANLQQRIVSNVL